MSRPLTSVCAIIIRVVVLPEPLGPSNVMNSFGSMARLKSVTAAVAPKLLSTWSSLTEAPAASVVSSF
jgi:hypothetical protein